MRVCKSLLAMDYLLSEILGRMSDISTGLDEARAVIPYESSGPLIEIDEQISRSIFHMTVAKNALSDLLECVREASEKTTHVAR